MAVYTDLTDEERDAVMAAYDLGALSAFKGIAEGVSNSNFFMETERGRFILTIFEFRFVEAELPFFMDVMARLAERGFPAPQPLPTREGALLTRVRGKPAAIVTFLSGVSPKRPNVAQCRNIGAALARMHRALEGFVQTRANALGPEGWSPLITPHLSLAETLRPGLAASVQADLSDVRARWPRDLPTGVIHADLFPDNALFVDDRIGGVIDFYFSCTDALAYDLAVCLNAWCFEDRGEYNITKGRALFGGYESVRALSSGERQALPLLARGAALRFFATRLADWSETPPGALVRPKDPLEYADKLDFHRKALSAGDYGA
ncbi:MAG TPA: homoserine kinase [Caulobacterales bacterium]|nr:homoserine kinase [Caulobacterales bacterium]